MPAVRPVPVNAAFVDEDMRLWNEYKRVPSPDNLGKLLDRFSGVINNQVNKWAGPIPRDVLLNEAKLLTKKALDSYNPHSGAALATWVTNSLLPLSRIVYTHQNTVRMPENITMKVNTYNMAVDQLTTVLGREPTTDELHDELGWTASEITRFRDYNRRDLLESGPAVSGDFFSASDDADDDTLLSGIYMELTPDEKRLFEHTTGFNGAAVLSNAELQKKLGITLSQLSYRKNLLRRKIEGIMARPGIRRKFA